MRKIILASLFFCLAITTVLAQVATINIATPNSNGLSNNQVNSFDVNSDGTILNNSATGGTAQLGNTTVTGNSNITAGSEADLILLQVTGTSGSDLDGAIEVFGREAGLIIANPNGIVCDGCGFINTSKVDLVTGTANFSGDDLTGFSIDGSSTLTVGGSGFLSDAVADELNLTSGRYTQSGTINITGDLNIQISGEASLDNNASIQSRNLFFSAYDLSNQADITITDNATFDIENDFFNGFNLDGTGYSGGDIIADNFNVTVGNDFFNLFNATISADNFNVTAGDDFYNGNSATINADSFNVTAAGNFFNRDNATINANDFNVTAGRNFFNWSNSTINADNFNVTAGDGFFNTTGTTIDAATVTIEVTNFDDDITNTGTISSDSLNFILTDDFTRSSTSFSGFNNFNNLGIITDGRFYNEADLTVNNFNVTAGDNFANYNNATINANNFNVTAGDDFNNSATINADTVTIEVTNFADNITNNAIISSDSLNIILTDDFIHNSTSFTGFNNFSNLAITTAGDYSQDGAIDIAGDLRIQASGEASLDDTASIKARNLFFSAYDIYNQADITITENVTFDLENNFLNGFLLDGTDYNGGDIIAGSFNVTAGNNFINRYNATIDAGSFNVTAGGRFRNLNEATINADSFNVTAGTDFGNEVGGIINADSFDVEVGDDFFNDNYAAINADWFTVGAGRDFFNDNNATINANEFNVEAEDDFSNSATINADTVTIEVTNFVNDIDNTGTVSSDSLNFILTNDFTRSSTSFSGFNNFNNLGIITDGSFTNEADLTLNNFNVTAGDDFNNSATINADTVTIDVTNFADNITNNATISSNSLNIILTDDFIHNSTSFTGFNFSNLAITTAGDYSQDGAIDIAGDLRIQASGETSLGDTASIKARNLFFSAYDLYNQADITITENATFDLENNFLNGFLLDGTDYNGGDIIADSFNVTAGNNFINRYSATTIIADSFNVTATGRFRNLNEATINADSFNVTAGTDFANEVAGTINANDFNVTTGTHFSNFYASSTINANSFNVTTGTYFANNNSGKINANDFNVTAENDFENDGAINADTVTIEVTNFNNDISNTATISSDSLNFILTDNFTRSSTSFSGFNNFNNLGIITDGRFYNEADLTVNNFNVTAGDNFANYNNATINANNFNVTAGDDFNNSATINADSFNVTAGDDFLNSQNATINADSFDVTTENNFSNYDRATINADSFDVTAKDFFNSNTSNINANNFNVTAGDDFYNRYNSTINTNYFNVTAGEDFYNRDSATIDAENFNVIATGDFTNQSSAIDAGIVLITTASNFNNSSSVNADILDILLNDVTGSFTNTGSASADTFTLSVAGDFDYVADFNGTITTNTFNLNVGGDFSNNDSANDFTWGANDTLTVLGSASVTADSFNNSGNIAVSNSSFDITATDFTNSGTISANTTLNTTVSSTVSDSFNNTGGVVSADTFALSVAGAFDYPKKGTITTNSFNLNVGGDFSNNDASSDFVWGANDTLTVLGSASVVADSFNNRGTIAVSNSSFDITATDLTNAGTISANTTLNTTVSSTVSDSFNNTGGVVSADTFALSVAGNFDYVTDYLDNGTITTNVFNLNVGGDFSNNDAANDFTWGANDALTVSGTASVVADSFSNSGTIAVSNSSFDITATDFTNSGTISANTTLNTTVSSTANNSFTNTGGVLNADTFALSVAGDFDYVADYLNGTITTNAFNLNVGGDFSNNDASSDFVWGANDTLTVLGTASVVADSFNNIGNINITNNSFDITAASLNNSGTISANTTLNTTVSSTVSGSFDNTGGVLNATAFALSVAGDFDYVADFNGTITTNAFNLNVGGNFSNNDASSDFVWGANDALTVLGTASVVADSFSNSGTIAVSNSSFDITATDFTNSGTISANTTLNTTVSSTVSGSFDNTGGVLNATAFALSVAGDFDYVADFNGTITTNTINLNVGGDFSNNDLANDFTWGANDSLTVLGSADITADSFNNSGNINANSFNVTVTDFTNAGTISANTTLNTTVSSTANNSFTNTGGVLNATAFALSVAGDFDYVAEYLGNGTITTNTLNLNVGGNFSNNDSANDFTWDENDTLKVLGSADITADSYTQNGAIDVTGVLTINVASDFDYVADFNGTITTNTLNLNVGGDFSNNDASSDFVWGANDTLTVLGTASVVADSFNNIGTIAVSNSSFDITATDFTNSGTISANTTLNTTLTSTLSGSFDNTGGVLNAHTVSLSVAGDFDGTKEGIINATIFNLTAGGSFINDDTNNDFVLGENDSLSILGDFTIATNNYIQSGMLDVAGALDISAMGDFTNNTGGSISADTLDISAIGDFTNHTGGSISADTLNITATGLIQNQGTIETANSLTINTDTIHNSGDITANSFLNINAMNDVFSGGSITTNALDIEAGRNFANGGTISTDSFEITAGYTVINQGSIASDSLDVTTDDFFRNLTGGEINVATLNITAGGKVTNTAAITAGSLNIIANNNSSRTDDTTGFYVSNRGDITADNLNITAEDHFYNRGDITADTLDITAKDIFFLNEEIDSFVDAYDGGDISLSGDSSFTADGEIENYGNIDLGGFNLIVAADSFINQASANISAERLNLYNVNSFLNEGVIDATIDQ